MKYLQNLSLVLVTLSLLSSIVHAVCSNFGKNCPEDAPCCNGGWCSNDPKFCSTGCEPENSFSQKSCYPSPPCVSTYDDFSKPSLVNWQNYTGNPNQANWTSDFLPDYSTYTNDGNLMLSMKYDGTKKNAQGNYQGFGSTVSSTRWLEFGTITASIKTGSTALGVVTSFITKNLVGDEIDYEWVGLSPDQAQTNYYYNGTLDYTKGVHYTVGADTTQGYHTYVIEWLPDHISWYVDGNLTRTVNKNDTWDPSLNVYKFPARQSRVQFSMWDGGMGAQGTAQWAGTPTDWSDQNKVYSMYVDWVNITCFYNGNSTTWPPAGYGPPPNATTNGTSYSTLGVGVPNTSFAPGTNNSEIVPYVPDYNQSALPKLVAPIAVLCSLTIIGSVAFGVWRYKRGKEIYVKQPF